MGYWNVKKLTSSIRFKFLAWYLIIWCLIFTLLGVTLYHSFKEELLQDLDELLLSKAVDVSSSINAYWEIKKNSLRIVDKNNSFVSAAKEWIAFQNKDLEFINIIVQIYSPDGNVIVKSKYLEDPLYLSSKILKLVKTKKLHYDKSYVQDIYLQKVDLRTLTLPIDVDGKIIYIVQTAKAFNTIERPLKKLLFLLLTIFPVTLIITGVLTGLFMTNIILSPLKELGSKIKGITNGQNLKLRINSLQGEDEIGELVDLFNDMLGRLDRVFDSEKQFLQNCSHELRTPLTIMRGEIEVFLKHKRTPEETDDLLYSNLKEIERLVRLVNDLLIISRAESVQDGLVFKKYCLNTIVEDILEDWEVLGRERGINILKKISDERINVLIVYDDFIRVLINLLDNAFKYSKECGGFVEVQLFKEDDWAVIKIIDTGIGIDPENRDKIFNRFFREARSTAVGLGLGLSMAQSIVSSHKGKISISSELGRGTEVTVMVPLVVSV